MICGFLFMKKCTKCNIEKDFSEFGNEKKGKNGLKSKCKECENNYRKQYILDNPEKRKETIKKYDLKNKERKKEYGRQWRIKNKKKEKRTR